MTDHTAEQAGRGPAQRRGSFWLTADRLVTGNRIIPPGKKRAVEIIGQLSDPGSAAYFEFACLSEQGASAVRLHRSEKVEVLRTRPDSRCICLPELLPAIAVNCHAQHPTRPGDPQ